jgi:hypothetical protein
MAHLLIPSRAISFGPFLQDLSVRHLVYRYGTGHHLPDPFLSYRFAPANQRIKLLKNHSS